jgi:hypothetical protein
MPASTPALHFLRPAGPQDFVFNGKDAPRRAARIPYARIPGATMTTSTSTTSSSLSNLGLIIEVSGVAAFLAGSVLGIHHYAIAALTIGGAAAFFIGKELRSSSL